MKVLGLLVLGVILSSATSEEFRSFDGKNNAKRNRGEAGSPMTRMAPNGYEDGSQVPRGGYPTSWLPGPREISNAMMGGGTADKLDPSGISSLFWTFAQFLDHDITLVHTNKNDRMDIPVPPNDPNFGQFNLTNLSFTRSNFDMKKGMRMPINVITAFIDGSGVYGSSETQAKSLRWLNGLSPFLQTSPGGLLPYNSTSKVYIAGDERASEQPGLTALHTVFLREHNRLVLKLQREHPTWSQDQVFAVARELVASIIQVITFDEFLPILIGVDPMTKTYQGYRSNVDPSIQTEFATTCYRFGHSLIPDELLVLDNNYCPSPKGSIPLKEGFFNVTAFVDRGLDSILRGLFAQRARRLDGHIVPALRNFLFVGRDSSMFGLDLASLNLQRGRDHGIPGYCEIRQALGFTTSSFGTLTRNMNVRRQLADLYNYKPCDVDMWLAGLVESRSRKTGLLGKTCGKLIAKQFAKLRDGDRFFVGNIDWTLHGLESDPVLAGGLTLSQVRLKDIIRLNTGIAKVPKESFFVDSSLQCGSR